MKSAPDPLPQSGLRAHIQGIDPSISWRTFLEPYLGSLSPVQGDRIMMLMEESRGAWAVLLAHPLGTALFIGNAVSGTVPALARLGWLVVVVDPSPERCAFARLRDREYAPHRVTHIQASHGDLPFQNRSFDLVVREDAADGLDLAHAPDGKTLCALSRGAVVHLADNRLRYKQATGERGRFERHSPLTFLSQVLKPGPGLRSLMGHRRALGGRASTRAYALYPDGREFSHVVGLGAPFPRLTIGPREKANLPKVIAQKLGLFPLLTPSFAIVREAPAPSFAHRLLGFLATRIGETAGELDQLIATRSNCAMLMTAPAGVRSEEKQGPLASGWVVHIPLTPGKQRILSRHAQFMRQSRENFPALGAPEVLFEGEFEGVYLCVSRRVGGWTAVHATDSSETVATLAQDLGRLLSSLVVRPAQEFSEADFESILGQRFGQVAEKCRRPETKDRVNRATDTLREALIGAVMPLVFHHSDLRAKHLMIDEQGKVTATLDFGSAESEFLPMVDLLHHLGHQRKQCLQCSAEDSWHGMADTKTRAPHEHQAIQSHASALNLEMPQVEAMLHAYPLFVAAMAEANWDWSRPEWIHREFGW